MGDSLEYLFQEWDSVSDNKDKVDDVIVKKNSMIRGITFYNETSHSFNVDGELVKPIHVGTWQITVEIHYDESLWPLTAGLGARVYQNSFLLTIEETVPEEEEAENLSTISWEPFKPRIPDEEPKK